MAEASDLVKIANFACRVYREQSISHLQSLGISPTMNALDSFLADFSEAGDLDFVNHFYSNTRYLSKIYGGTDYINENLSNLLNSIRSYVRLNFPADSLGQYLESELPGILHVNSDYQYLHRILYGSEDPFYYYRLVGSYDLTVTPAGASSHSGYNKYTLAMSTLYKTYYSLYNSFVPQNDKYTVSPDISLPGTYSSDATIYVVCDTLSANGETINENVEVEFNVNATHGIKDNSIFLFGRKINETTRRIWSQSNLTSGHNIIKMKEIHVVNSFGGTLSVSIHSGTTYVYASDFYTGTELNTDDINYTKYALSAY